ncbi:MAG TPA: hypothetical protein VHA11_00275 [Bryobacteraceae bacterium]|nr:hypothetical protein [Bryobacteraceae bacterium]
MATNTSLESDVLHSENHSKLSEEAIAKALARHNRHHPAGAGNTSAKAKKVTKA